ncbi:MAG: hypothetical protein US89_C0002G0037 [Candidatus Peregrinibacteria bacterium GW2011_GWF2_38_29]|nr:MAG: hypothetical protein US89_C0002G0037 [Candidatus Peregrinibacteria bacterium GW2011_GWF2_38_29]HBB02193.1 hypothetical protein [Candidatus Peregrinibacteria bacterium]
MKNRTLKIIFAVLLCVFIFIAANVARQAWAFRVHKDYFKQPIEQQKIQEWMTFRLIERRYNVKSEAVLHKTLSFPEFKSPISNYCVKEKLDCNKLIIDLENYRGLNSNKVP